MMENSNGNSNISFFGLSFSIFDYGSSGPHSKKEDLEQIDRC
jgi:hypothetical protein